MLASLYSTSPRPYPRDLPEPTCPGHFEVRRVIKIGVFSWKQRQIFITEALRHETLSTSKRLADDEELSESCVSGPDVRPGGGYSS